MKQVILGEDAKQAISEILGYLNYSSGAKDLRFFTSLNTLFEAVATEYPRETYSHVIKILRKSCVELTKESETFRNSDQAETVLHIVDDIFFDAYREFHRDLLFHQSNEFLFNSFFIGQAFQAILQQDFPWSETEQIVSGAIDKMNCLIGYRPVPILEGREKHEANPHEWVAPIPLYIDGAGAAFGKYKEIVEVAMQILQTTDPALLRDAWLDPEKIEELVLDPRAYDFDHPVNRKPNYHFGIWDPLYIDNNGYYRRFIVHQVTIDCIYQRIEMAYTGESDVAMIPPKELLFECGSVLAGTMLMGSGVSGDTPHTHDSSTSLASLMPHIAEYRDRFYDQLIEKLSDPMKSRMIQEAARLHQPFAGARQDLNKRLAKRRADQLQRLHLARTFARMGYFDAAERQTSIIAVASARILCKIDCLITQSHFLADRNQLDKAAVLIVEMEDLLYRGIACGAMVDPWSIIGFGAQFSLFPSVENTVHDHRVDDLIQLMDDIFDLYSRLQKEAAASGNGDLQADLSDRMSDLANWWDQYGSTEISGIEGFSGIAAWESAAMVSTALAAWNKAGTAAGDIAFWSRHVDRFKSPKAYVLLGEALLDQRDPVASMALMMHWLSQAEEIPLTEGDYSFHSIAIHWMEMLWREKDDNDTSSARSSKKIFSALSPEERWNLTKKFFDFAEANAEKYWYVPRLELTESMFDLELGSTEPRKTRKRDISAEGFSESDIFDDDMIDEEELSRKIEELLNEGEEDPFGDIDSEEVFGTDDIFEVHGDDEDDDQGIDPTFSAAYENVTYHDTADDGNEDDTLEGKGASFGPGNEEFELAEETERISERLAFIITMAKLWKFAAAKSPVLEQSGDSAETTEEAKGRLEGWLQNAKQHWNDLLKLLEKTSRYRVPAPRGTQDSLIEYDRHRGTKEILLDRIVWTSVEVADTILLLRAALGGKEKEQGDPPWLESVLNVIGAVFRNDPKQVKQYWPRMLRLLSRETLLYIPTSRGGDPMAIVNCRRIQQVILRLLDFAPQLGLIIETFQLLETIEQMEQHHLNRPGAITEYDRLVESATRSITNCISESSKSWRIAKDDALFESSDQALVDYLEQVIELLLASWLSHSRQIRISPIESIMDRKVWGDVKAFIQKFGSDLFTQQFMGFGNLRAVLHQGVENYLRSLVNIYEDEGELEMGEVLVKELAERKFPWDEAVFCLEIIFEAIAENYSEYIDYNSTTTHSDKGERLYMLLDMLRVQTGYERISWNLKPVYWIHDAMIRADCSEAAALWERAVARRSVTAADEHLRQYVRLSEKYGMWLPSVHERLNERFIRPLQIDRMCGLVAPAIRQAKEDGPKPAFESLDAQIELFAREPMGVGFEMPEWLSALQEEVMAPRSKDGEHLEDVYRSGKHFEQVRLPRKELERQINAAGKRRK